LGILAQLSRNRRCPCLGTHSNVNSGKIRIVNRRPPLSDFVSVPAELNVIRHLASVFHKNPMEHGQMSKDVDRTIGGSNSGLEGHSTRDRIPNWIGTSSAGTGNHQKRSHPPISVYTVCPYSHTTGMSTQHQRNAPELLPCLKLDHLHRIRDLEHSGESGWQTSQLSETGRRPKHQLQQRLAGPRALSASHKRLLINPPRF
jgi:hypothetical protein